MHSVRGICFLITLLLVSACAARQVTPAANPVGAFGRDAPRLVGDYLPLRFSITGQAPLVVICDQLNAEWSRVSLTRPSDGVRVAADLVLDEKCQVPASSNAQPRRSVLLVRRIHLDPDTSLVTAEHHRGHWPRSWVEHYVWTAEPVPGNARLTLGEFAPVH